MRSKERFQNYLELIRRFPLRAIRSDRDLKAANKLVDELLDRKLSKGEEDYLDVLSILIEQHESLRHAIPPVSDREVLLHLIEARDVSKRQVALAAGIAVSTMSELVSGKRAINRTHIEKLAAYFNVEPGVFLDGGNVSSPGLRFPGARRAVAAKRVAK